jgi:ferredoxin-thioredoxin reductase catalytic subunit
MNKKYFRCNVCNDIHFGSIPPEICPTCGAKHAYVEIEKREACNIQEIEAHDDTRTLPPIIISMWETWTKNNDFHLNPEKWHVETVAKGILINEKKYALKLCPCRLRNGSREMDLELICPCNFKSQPTWSEKGECWCGLFIKNDTLSK